MLCERSDSSSLETLVAFHSTRPGSMQAKSVWNSHYAGGKMRTRQRSGYGFLRKEKCIIFTDCSSRHSFHFDLSFVKQLVFVDKKTPD